MIDQKVRIGIIGLGGMAYAHELAIQQLSDIAQVIAVCDVLEEKVRKRVEEDKLKGYTNYLDLTRDPEVDSVLITVPHVSNSEQLDPHYEIARAALLNKKHVFVEKPIALQASRAEELINLARDNGLKYSTAENTRFIPSYIESARQLENGTLGEIYFVRTEINGSNIDKIRRRGNWRFVHPDGGVILDVAIHSFYLLKWLFGGVKDISTFVYKMLPEGVPEDNAVFTGHLVSGTYFCSAVSVIAKVPWTERLEIYGNKGALIVDHLVDPPVVLYSGTDGKIEQIPINAATSDPQRWKWESIVEEERDFLEAIRQNRDPVIDPQDGMYAVRVVEIAYASARLGKRLTIDL